VESGVEFDSNTTVRDIVNFEQEHLGNAIHITPELLNAYGDLSARSAVWVTGCREDALRYAYDEEGQVWIGEVIEFEIPIGSIIIGCDDEGGYLVVKERRRTSSAPDQPHTAVQKTAKAIDTLSGKEPITWPKSQ